MTWTRTNVSRSYTTTGPQTTEADVLGNRVFQFTQGGVGAVQLDLEMSNDNIGWESAGSIGLSTPGDHSYLVVVNSWRYFRVNLAVLTATSVALEMSGG